jgi:hypothetical protein
MRVEAECLRGGTFDRQVPSPVEANTSVWLSILDSVPVVNKYILALAV